MSSIMLWMIAGAAAYLTQVRGIYVDITGTKMHHAARWTAKHLACAKMHAAAMQKSVRQFRQLSLLLSSTGTAGIWLWGSFFFTGFASIIWMTSIGLPKQWGLDGNDATPCSQTSHHLNVFTATSAAIFNPKDSDMCCFKSTLLRSWNVSKMGLRIL